MLELQPDLHSMVQFYPFPSTEAMEICKKNGWLKEQTSTSYLQEDGIEMPWFSSEQMKAGVKELTDAFYEMNLKKKPKGYMDFATSIDVAAKQTPPDIPVTITSMFDDCFEIVWISAHPVTVLTYGNVAIRPNTDLKFGMAMSRAVYDSPGGGVEFRVEVNGRKVFAKKLDPKRKEKDRGWFFHKVPLDKLAGKSVSITFRTTAFGRGGAQYCTAGWARPHLLQRKG
jgi:hypothetical protein